MRKRESKRIKAHEVDKYIDKSRVSMLQESLNGDLRDLKRIARDVIKSLPKIKYKNGKQKDFHKLMLEKEVVACQGKAGTGKTYIAVYSALVMLMDKDSKIERIVLTKPVKQLATEEMGFIKGGVDEKIAPIMESFDGVFEELIGIANLKTLVEKGVIVYKPMAFLRGQTLKNAVVLFDEVQIASLHATRTLLQRLGEDSRIVLLGDKSQTESRNRRNNSLTLIIEKMLGDDEFGTFEFLLEDVVRNKLIIKFEKMFDEIEEELLNKKEKK